MCTCIPFYSDKVGMVVGVSSGGSVLTALSLCCACGRSSLSSSILMFGRFMIFLKCYSIEATFQSSSVKYSSLMNTFSSGFYLSRSRKKSYRAFFFSSSYWRGARPYSLTLASYMIFLVLWCLSRSFSWQTCRRRQLSMTASSSEISLMLISNLMFSSIRFKFSRLVPAFDSDNFFTIYSNFFILLRRMRRLSIKVRLNFFYLDRDQSRSRLECLRVYISFWYSWCSLLICSSSVRSFLTDCPLRAYITAPTSSFSLFHNIFRIQARFFEFLATWLTISVKPAAIRVCLFSNLRAKGSLALSMACICPSNQTTKSLISCFSESMSLQRGLACLSRLGQRSQLRWLICVCPCP